MKCYKSYIGFKVGMLAALLSICFFSFSYSAKAKNSKRLRRFALVVGANHGGAKRAELRYANSDAKAFQKMLLELAGVHPRDLILITDATKAGLSTGLKQMQTKLQQAGSAGVKLEIIFYYSGHSNETGLLLGEEVYTYKEIKDNIKRFSADVRIGILDSCSSGTLVRTKGGTRTAPFLFDTSTNIKGYALLTSSSADEAAQESDRIEGSYFTHFLISGLRGAADFDKDGQVTLNESYTYAFNETLYRTEFSQAGPQHPNYDFKLAGAGELVLTDIRITNAVLVIDETVSGKAFIRNQRGKLVAEISKSPNKVVRLAIEPGQYKIILENKKGVYQSSIEVKRYQPAMLRGASFQKVTLEKTVTRGETAILPESESNEGFFDDAHTGGPVDVGPGDSESAKSVPDDIDSDDAASVEPMPAEGPVISASDTNSDIIVFAGGFFPGVSTNPKGKKITNRAAVNIIGVGHGLWGVEVAVFANVRLGKVRGAQAGLVNSAGYLEGVQAGLVNTVTGKNAPLKMQYGAQTGLVNLIKIPDFYESKEAVGFRGAQVGLVNVAHKVKGVQVGLVNKVEYMKGVQVGLINIISNGKVKVAPILNVGFSLD